MQNVRIYILECFGSKTICSDVGEFYRDQPSIATSIHAKQKLLVSDECSASDVRCKK